MKPVEKKNIFVTVGSTDFDALIEAVDRLVPRLGLTGIMQIGHGRIHPVHLPFFRFAKSLDNYYQQADLVIAHGGLATTIEILQRHLPLISLSNHDRFDNHQDDLLRAMEARGHLLWCRRVEDLEAAIVNAQQAEFTEYQNPDCRIQETIIRFIEAHI